MFKARGMPYHHRSKYNVKVLKAPFKNTRVQVLLDDFNTNSLTNINAY